MHDAGGCNETRPRLVWRQRKGLGQQQAIDVIHADGPAPSSGRTVKLIPFHTVAIETFFMPVPFAVSRPLAPSSKIAGAPHAAGVKMSAPTGDDGSPPRPPIDFERVRARLRAELGEAVFTSWFARLELETIAAGTAYLSVPTRFLKSWIESHYLDRLLATLVAGDASIVQVAIRLRGSARPLPAISDCASRIPPAHGGAESGVDFNGKHDGARCRRTRFRRVRRLSS